MRLNDTTKVWLFIVGLFALLAIGGTADHTEAVMLEMTDSVYEDIRSKIGADASEYEIARYYLKNKERYAE